MFAVGFYAGNAARIGAFYHIPEELGGLRAKLLFNFSVADVNQCDSTVKISENLQPGGQFRPFYLDQVFVTVFLLRTDCSSATGCS